MSPAPIDDDDECVAAPPSRTHSRDLTAISPRSHRDLTFAVQIRPTPRDRFDITRAANASWREAEYTKERARSAESELATAHETIRTLEAKLMTTESRLAQEKRGVAAELQRARDAATEQAARHEHRVAELQQTHDARFAALHDRHRALQSEMAALQASIPAAAGGAVGVAEVETTLESERRAAEETRLKNLELDLNEHHASEYENLERTKDGQIKNLKDQTAYFLAKKDDELRALALEHDNYRREKEAECERLHEECEYLHGWAMSMNSVLENVESGAYPVVEAGGLRTLTIPVDGKPGSLDVPSLAARAEDARRFLEETSTLTNATGRSENIETVSGKTTTTSGGSKLGKTTTNSAADAFELEAFKTHGDLIDAERAAVADATLRELSSHPTVEYIRHLEEENARIASQLSRATRSVSDMRVALNSAVRQVNARSTAAPLTGTGGATLSRVSSARGDGTPGSAPPLASRPAPRSSGLLTSALKNRDPLDVAFGTTKSNAATSGPFRDVETNALVHTHRAGLHKTNAYASGGARPAYLTHSNEPAYKTATNYHPAGDGPHKPRTHRTAAFGLNAATPGRMNATSTLERASVGVLNDRAVEARAIADGPTRIMRAEARAAEREERERTRGVRSFLETQALTGSRVNGLGASTVVGGVETIGELNAARDEALRSYARENRVASHRSRGRDPTLIPAAPLGGASGRLASDRVPLPGRPISGTAEVGYGWVLGDGIDKDGGTVGWPAKGPGSTGEDLSRSSDGSHVATAANALEGSAWRNAPGAGAFGVAGKIGEQRGDGVRSAMMMVPAEVIPAAGAPTPAVEPPPGA